MDWRSTVPVAATGLQVPRVGVGTAPLGNMLQGVSDAEADRVLAEATRRGLRYFDTAPLYGHGLAEERVGRAVSRLNRDETIISTKVGRLLRRDAARDETQYFQSEPFYKDTPPVGPVWDFSHSGVVTSLHESLQRLGTDRVDLLLLHDPDDHYEIASTTAYEALAELRAEGTVRGIGAGMNQSAMLARLVNECDLDVVLCAGRYTLLEQGALDDLMPACESTTTSVVIGGVFNSGVLVDPAPGALYDYIPAGEEVIARAAKINAVCERFGVPLPAAALQFPLAHPRVSTVLIGFRSEAELHTDLDWLDVAIPVEMWEELRRHGLIREDAPTPTVPAMSAPGEAP
jgi:D-threo-aldose 1-dehydrogenase